MSAWVLIIIIGGGPTDKTAAALSIDMPTQAICLTEVQQVSRSTFSFNRVTAFCISREARS